MRFVPGILPTYAKMFFDILLPAFTVISLYIWGVEYYAGILLLFTLITVYGTWLTAKGLSYLAYPKYMDREIWRQTSFGTMYEMNNQQKKFNMEQCPKCKTKHLRYLFIMETDIYGVVGIHPIGNTLIKCNNCEWKLGGHEIGQVKK
ncbi:hypothetical protein LCGC14_0303540 [marine sediment metagenome]|uniref:Uncharacterized protein n=1 Tax=marine sediment metagenome TaxID=412755 RepID=A0A0F9WVW4_9ZZZZ